MSKPNTNIAQTVANLARPIIEKNGLILWDVRFEKEGPDWMLRILVDRDNPPIDMNACEHISRILSDMLDEEDPIDHSYMLEIGSPGLGRRLYTLEHFTAKINEKVQAHLYTKNEDGLRDITGILIQANQNDVQIQEENTQKIYTVPIKNASYFKLCDDENLFD